MHMSTRLAKLEELRNSVDQGAIHRSKRTHLMHACSLPLMRPHDAPCRSHRGVRPDKQRRALQGAVACAGCNMSDGKRAVWSRRCHSRCQVAPCCQVLFSTPPHPALADCSSHPASVADWVTTAAYVQAQPLHHSSRSQTETCMPYSRVPICKTGPDVTRTTTLHSSAHHQQRYILTSGAALAAQAP